MHGAADPIFSLWDTTDWWERVNRRERGTAADFARVFPVPGMNHCTSGPAAFRFDAFDALVKWVEHGVAPDRIIGSTPASSRWPGRTRPLCPYPMSARYLGRGDIDDAGSFACRRS